MGEVLEAVLVVLILTGLVTMACTLCFALALIG